MAKAGVAWSPTSHRDIMTSTAFDSSHGKKKRSEDIHSTAAAATGRVLHCNSL